MKANSLVYPLCLALAAVSLATTGCKHKPMGITQLPGQVAPASNGGGGDLNQGGQLNQGGGGLGSGTGGVGNTPMAEINLDNYNQDRQAFAAHTVHFPFDSSAIKTSEEANVAAVASALSGTPANALLIEGHCDERGTEEYNRALGERRADALREDLVKLGVGANRIKTISYGKDHPVDPGHTEAAFAKNRRGEFILLTPKAGTPGV